MKRRCADECLQIPVASSAPHWQPVRSTKKIASIALRSSTRGLWHPSGWRFREGKSGSISAHNASGNLHPSSLIAAFPMRAPLVRGGGHVKEASLAVQELRAVSSRFSRKDLLG
jgi:hypothetical protein